MAMAGRDGFADGLRARQPMIGTFVKLRDPAVVEMLRYAGFDFVVVDAEHAPFDRAAIAAATMAARAADMAALVRVPVADGHWISTALDCGAAGVVVPQVKDAAAAGALVQRCRYHNGLRGFSPSTAAAGYGARSIAEHLEAQDKETVLVCQLEDRSAADAAAEIAGVKGVDGLLVGPVDLAVSEGGNDPAAPQIRAIGERILKSARDAGIAGGMFISDTASITAWRDCGGSLFVLGADQSFLLRSARESVSRARESFAAKGGNEN